MWYYCFNCNFPNFFLEIVCKGLRSLFSREFSTFWCDNYFGNSIWWVSFCDVNSLPQSCVITFFIFCLILLRWFWKSILLICLSISLHLFRLSADFRLCAFLKRFFLFFLILIRCGGSRYELFFKSFSSICLHLIVQKCFRIEDFAFNKAWPA